jgi:hypothetical protein
MAQLFGASSTVWSRASIIGGGLLVSVLAAVLIFGYRSPLFTNVDEAREQTVPFSHQHHVGGLGIDCRYCHTSVEKSSFAGIPPTSTCMTCHSQVWNTSPMLAAVRQSYQNNTPLQWLRVNAIPDFAYFNHSIHIRKGVGCATCHGPVNKMPLTWKANTLYMGWCLDCHRNPEANLRPREQVFNMNYSAPPDQASLGAKLVKLYDVKKNQLTDCSICHR